LYACGLILSLINDKHLSQTETAVLVINSYRNFFV
jgi:hypothetical protein